MFGILKATRERFFRLRIGENQLITIADGNKIINYLDAVGKVAMSNTKFDFLLTDVGGVSAMGIISNGIDAACALNGTMCSTNLQGKIYDFYKPNISANRVSPGVWDIIITPEPGSAINFLTTSILVGNPPQPSVITVVKSATTEGVYTISVVDLAGAPIDAGLNSTLLTVSYNIDYVNTQWT